MSFLAPIAFWFAATLPVVILFYLLKRKRVVRLVPSTLLWQKFLAETQASAPFQRLRHNWLLLLQLLLLILAILALARPYMSGRAASNALQVLVLDASASMQSTDESPSRFERARSSALKWVDTLRDTDQMVVLQAAAATEVKLSRRSEKAEIKRAIRECAVADSPTRLAEALKMAESLTRDVNEAEIHLFSDGAAPDLREFENKGLRITYHRVGQRGENAGIVMMDVRSNPEDASQRAVFATVGNFSTNKIDTQLELRFDGQLVQTRQISLPPTNSVAQVFVTGQERDGVFTVRLVAKDDLPTDNEASLVSLLPQPVRVMLVTAGNRFLEKALRAVDGVELAVVNDLRDPKPPADLVVLDDVVPSVWPTVNILSFRAAAGDWFAEKVPVEGPTIVGLRATHALARFVTFDNVLIGEALEVKPPSWSVAIAETARRALIVAGEVDRRRVVWVGFQVTRSSWPQRISFPIFIANAVEWLNPAAMNAAQLSVRSGSPFRYGLPAGQTNAEVTLPDGTKRRVGMDPQARELVFGDTHRQGVYRMQSGTNRVSFCVNLLDAAESSTMPRAELEFGKFGKVTASVPRRANLELWRWIAAAALSVLLFEWWFYHKRTA
jgi:hypothetical protein